MTHIVDIRKKKAAVEQLNHTPAQVSQGAVRLSTKVTLVNKEKRTKKESYTTTKTTITIVTED
jgi:hypothetical protein